MHTALVHEIFCRLRRRETDSVARVAATVETSRFSWAKMHASKKKKLNKILPRASGLRTSLVSRPSTPRPSRSVLSFDLASRTVRQSY